MSAAPDSCAGRGRLRQLQHRVVGRGHDHARLRPCDRRGARARLELLLDLVGRRSDLGRRRSCKQQKAAAAAQKKLEKDVAKAEKAALKEQKAVAAAEAKAVKDAAKAEKTAQKEKLAKESQIAKENRQREREEKKRVTDAEKLKKNKFREAVKAIAKDEGITQKAAILKLQEGSYVDKYLSVL